MTLSASTLKAAIVSEIQEFFDTQDAQVLNDFAEALATAIVDHITNNAVVNVTGVTVGVGTAQGTIT